MKPDLIIEFLKICNIENLLMEPQKHPHFQENYYCCNRLQQQGLPIRFIKLYY